jgi:hypothetical protein
MEERFGSSDDLTLVTATLKACMLRPGTSALSGTLGVRVGAAIERDSNRGSHAGSVWTTLALADYRAGAPGRALTRIALARSTAEYGSDESLQALTLSVEAASLNRLGRSGAARGALERAGLILKPVFSEAASGTTLGGDWCDWMTAQVVYREAQAALVDQTDFPADPFADAPQ